jgi:hypothetical protein
MTSRHRSILVTLFVALGCLHGSGGATQDGPYTIPIYVNPGTFGPSKYTIYASLGTGAFLPYLFDTGSPNLFTFADAQGGTPTASFAFGSGNPVYSYFSKARIVGLGAKGAAKAIASTRRAVNVAEVVQINGNSNFALPLGDGTYGDFGAGLYGTSTLATVLAQVPLRSGLKVGYVVDVAGRNAGSGTLTLGLTARTIENLRQSPGAFTMRMTPSGMKIPTARHLITGFNKAQVGGTQVQVSQGGQSFTLAIGTVLDTGGGANAVIYETGHGKLAPVNLRITYGGRTIVQDNGTTPWNGTPQVIDTSVGGPRVNPGGSIYQNNIVLFDIEGGQLTLVPASGSSPAKFAKRGTIRVTATAPDVYEIRGRIRDSNGLRAVSISVGKGDDARLYRARVRGGLWIASNVRPDDRAPTLKFEVLALDRAGDTARHAYRIRLPR